MGPSSSPSEFLLDPSPTTIVALALVAALAGFIDAIAGGGGLLTVPALLAAGVPTQVLFGTNKGASVFGSAAALVRFWRAGLIERSWARVLFPLGVVGALAGAALILALDPRVVRPLVLVLLVLAGVVVAFVRPRAATAPALPPTRALRVASLLALGIGAYDGFFGPGTGTFLILGFVGLLHLSLQAASANAKVVNFASNVAAVALFASRDVVLWKLSLPMALGQLVGGTLGAHVTVRGGDRVVRPVVLLVVVGLVVKLALDLLRGA